jgi:hypothetical protein
MSEPLNVSEAEVNASFSPVDTVAVFHNIGSVNIEDLRHIYALPFGKSSEVHSWARDRLDRVWQMNIALGIVRYGLVGDQLQYAIDLGSAIPSITRETADQWEQNAIEVKLPRNVGRGLFTTIGDDRCPGQLAAIGKARVLPQCVCTTHAGNWSCNDSCQGEGSCNVVTGDCGFLWLYDCNGMCDNREN